MIYVYSICYSYEGIFPTKGAMKSQMSDMDDNSKSPFYLPMINVRHDNVKTSDSSEGNDSQKKEENPNCYLPLRFVSKFQVRN